MAKRVAGMARPKQTMTGLSWPCPSNVIENAHGTIGSVAVRIRVDRNGHFYAACSSCGSRIFFSKEFWTAETGYSMAQASAMGLTTI